MSVTLILDIVYVAVLLICVLIGLIKGWTKTLLGFVLVFAAGFIANWLLPVFLPMVKDFEVSGEPLHQLISSKSIEFIDSSFSFMQTPIDAKLATEHNIKAIVCGSFYVPASFWPTIWGLVQPNIEAATVGGEVSLDIALGNTAADGACSIITWVILYLAVYIIGTIIINIVLFIIDRVRKAKSPDHKIHRSALSRILGIIFGLLIGSSMIVGLNTTAHIFTSIDAEGKILPIEAALGIENGEQVTPSFSGWVYLVTGKISDTFFPANTAEQTNEENLNNLVITLDKDDPSVTIPAMGEIAQDSIPDGMDEYITVGEDGSLTVELPTTEEGYEELISNVSTASGVSEEQVEAYLEAAGVEVVVNEDGSVTYNISIPTDPEELAEWYENLSNLSADEPTGEGTGEGAGE